MKTPFLKTLTITLALASLAARVTHGQGVVGFDNNIWPLHFGTHIWGPPPTDPSFALIGLGSNDSPSGTTPFGAASGMTLIGANGSGGQYGYATTFAQLIGAVGANQPEYALVPVGQTTTFKSLGGAGWIAPITDVLTGNPAIPADAAYATFEIVAWDNQSGNYPTWTEAVTAWRAHLITAGHSAPFTVSAIGGTINTVPVLNDYNPTALTSFNLHFASQLVAYYPFNGIASDESDYGNSPRAHGSPQLVSDALGQANAAFNLNGTTDYITAPAASQLNVTEELSIALWIKPRIANNHVYLTLVSYSSSSADQYALDFTPQNQLQYTYYASGYHDTVDTSGTVWADNVWQHVCVVVTPLQKTVQFYKNGSLLSTVAQSFTPPVPSVSSPTLYLGLNPGENYHFPGGIDNVRIYSLALSPSAVQHIYAVEAPPWLTATRSGTSVVVAWPSPYTGYDAWPATSSAIWFLQECSGLPSSGWVGASGYAVTDDGTTRSITVNLPTGSVFFRLACNRALSFDGAATYVSVGASAVAAPWTAEFWVNRQDAPNYSASLLGDSSTALKLEQYNFSRKVGFSSFGVADYTFNYSAPACTWVHLAFVCDTTTRLYVNGALQDTINTTIPLPLGRIGYDSSGHPDYLSGTLDEVRVWNVARTPAQIQASMNHLLAGPQPNLVGYWKFDDGAGTSAADSSGQGKTGTLQNAPAWVISTAPIGP